MAIDEYLREINKISRNMGRSPINTSVSNAFYGLNITGRNGYIPTNTENHGYTFFTRPLMNMSYDNLIVDRVMSNLLLEQPHSVQRMIRCYLDPSLGGQGITSPGIDPLNPFIPLLSNNLISLSGWPDFTINTQTSQPGVYREAYSYVDDIPYNYETFDLQASFRNLAGDPISFMMLIWGWYMGLVYEGRLMPYPDLILKNEIDYNTRIYRLIMDKSRRYVTRIGATGASFPMTSPIGNIFNFEGDGSETPFPTANDQITVNFRCMGFTYYDHVLVYEFNRVVELFNTQMKPNHLGYEMVKLNQNEKEFFNYSAYPHINELTMELEWYVERQTYQREIENIIN